MRIRVKIYGKVQGIGFRDAIHSHAVNLGVNGWVKNNTDGTVEALFEGDNGLVDQAINFCKRGPERAKVENINIIDEHSIHIFEDFRIIY